MPVSVHSFLQGLGDLPILKDLRGLRALPGQREASGIRGLSTLRDLGELSDLPSLRDLRWSLYQDLQADLHDLRYLFWEATRQCNLACRHCGSDCTRDHRVAGMPLAEVAAVLRQIAGRYDPTRIMLVITGGEPLVRPDLPAAIALARDLGFNVGMVTNGIALSPKVARIVRQAGLVSVVVSLDGPPDCHDWLRRRQGAFDLAAAGIRSLVEAGVPVVEAITCVTPRSLPRLAETFDIVRRLGATHFRVFNIFPAGRAKGNPELILTPGGISSLVGQMARLRERGKRLGLVVNLSEEGYLGWEWEDRVRDTPYFCRAGINIAGIMADGSIAACPNLPPRMTQGHLGTEDFVTVWETRYSLFRDRRWTRQGSCAGCAEWRVCRGNSLHLWNDARGGPHWCHYKILRDIPPEL